jgi:integrase
MALIQRNGIWYWRKMVDGVMFNRSTKTDDKKLAETLARRWEHEAVQAVVYDGERPVTVHEAIKGFLAERENTGGYENACQHMNRWKAAIPNVLFKSVQKHQVQAIVAKMQADEYAHNTIAVAVRYWNALVNYCESKKLSAGPKIDKVQPKRTRFRVVSPAEEAAMLAATCPNAKYPGKTAKSDAQRQDNQDMLVCLLHLGARLNEAQNLRWSDVDFANNTIFVRRLKKGDDCVLLMTRALRAVMERRHASRDDKWVFPAKAGKNTGNAQWVKTIAIRAGVDFEVGKVTSHTFRHSAATRLLRAGMDIRKLQRFLGHKNIQSTLVYLHSLPDEVAAHAVAVFDAS